jgi:hypothetical protein
LEEFISAVYGIAKWESELSMVRRMFVTSHRSRPPIRKLFKEAPVKTLNMMSAASIALIVLTAAVPAGATVIDFEAQAMNTGGSLTGTPNSPLSIGIATFTGGELRDGEVGLPVDQTGVYASEGLFGSGETNPLVISFATPVTGFGVLVANADDTENYTVSDNLGDSLTLTLAGGGTAASVFSLSGNAITTVDISSSDADAWTFAIDNVTFDEATTAPEPKSLLLLAIGFVLLPASHFVRIAAKLRK